ncbi:MAG: glycosidase [Firmicutes bacterium HGW-Firmicutes-2]|jgi:sucrose phosphorylase|nr:MAG: glycosidase [Firmicutes bacterium HGW-Firmicutes-2]
MDQRNQEANDQSHVSFGPMLNVYPDSIGGSLSSLVTLLKKHAFRDVFESLYILPSVFNTDLDRGFSVIDYELNALLASKEDLEDLNVLGMDFKFDFILNHASVLSKPFQDIIKKGDQSIYRDFFIDWNRFWEGNGHMTDEGYIQPEDALIRDMFFRKPGLPILNVRMPDGKEVPYWNTFYQEIRYNPIDATDLMWSMDLQYGQAQMIAETVNQGLLEGIKPSEIDFGHMASYKNKVVDFIESHRKYLGQMDLNIKSPLVWDFYEDTLKKLAGYGAGIVRLDAFAYAPKAPGEKNFLNEPGTWDLLERVKALADRFDLNLLPEIHSKYEEKIHEKIASEGFMTYDFFLPGLIIDAFENHSSTHLVQWIRDLQTKNIQTVNMLGCHDGIPLLDLKGLLSEGQIQNLIDVVVSRGGYVKDLHGKKNIYYQVNATYYSALGEDDQKMLLARAIQMFMPGKPQVWYLDLFAGRNDYEAVKRAGAAGHKEINRTNLTIEEIEARLEDKVVREQIELIRFRHTFPAFGLGGSLEIIESLPHKLILKWEKNNYIALLEADLMKYTYKISTSSNTFIK